jgi:hypothetical protein
MAGWAERLGKIGQGIGGQGLWRLLGVKRGPAGVEGGRVSMGEETRFRGTFDAVGKGMAGAIDKATGRDFRLQFEEFTDAVTTSILGIHRDQTDLRKRIERLEQDISSRKEPAGASKLGVSAFIVSLVALSMGALALVLVWAR